MYIILKFEGGSILLVDVEGINFGDDKVIVYFSMFIVMILVRFILFIRDYVGNIDIDFFYYIFCLSYFVFLKKEDF